MSRRRLRIERPECRYFVVHEHTRSRHAARVVAVPVTELEPWENGRSFVRTLYAGQRAGRPATLAGLLSKELLVTDYRSVPADAVAAFDDMLAGLMALPRG